MKSSSPELPGLSLEYEIGHGAHSSVYRARRGGERCVVKVLRSPSRWARWAQRDAVALARLPHPSLPRVIEIGAVEGLPYLVTELVDGETLAERLARRAFTEPEAVGLSAHLLDALAVLHGAGLVHRDVRPCNVVLGVGGAPPRLVDFGFATPMERAGAAERAGAEEYAAPEQLTLPSSVDARADLYSLGRLLGECLVAVPGPRRAPWPRGAGGRAALLGAGVTAAFADFLEGLVAQRRDERYPDARAARAELERLRTGAPLRGVRGAAFGAGEAEVVRLHEGARDRIVAAVRRSAAEGAGSLVSVTGAPGAGKSRLLAACAAELRETGMIVVETAGAGQEPPFAVATRVSAALAAALDGAGHGGARAVLGAVGDAPAPFAPGVGEALLETAAVALAELARHAGGCAIVVDDVDAVDSASLATLQRLGERLEAVPVHLVLAGPDGGVPAAERASADGRRALVVPLGALDLAAVRGLVRAHLGGCEPPAGVVERIGVLAGGTPCGVIEIVELFLDEGALHVTDGGFHFDAARAASLRAPDGIAALLRRRFAMLPPGTARIVETAALLDGAAADALLARAHDLTLEEVGFELAAAVRAGILVPDGVAAHRFAAAAVRRAIVAGTSPDRRRAIHRQLAELLGPAPAHDAVAVFRLAHHHASGELADRPEPALAAIGRAAEIALARGDGPTAAALLEQAQRIAAASGVAVPPEHLRWRGEAALLVGRLDASLTAFGEAAAIALGGEARAELLGRIAWVHHLREEPERAWEALGAAFAALGAELPVESPVTALGVAASAVRKRLAPRAASPAGLRAGAILAQLHYQNARLGLELGRPLRLLQSSLEGLALARALPPGRLGLRLRALHGHALATLRLRGRGASEVLAAEEESRARGDLATRAFCLQLRAAAAFEADSLETALELARECSETCEPWLEASDRCLDLFDPQSAEALRGRSREAWGWVERALARRRRSPAILGAPVYLVHAARAALAALGRESPDDPWLVAQLAAVPPTQAGEGRQRLASFGPRARYWVERGELGPELEALVREVDRAGIVAASAPSVLGEYYVAIGQARLQQCLASPPPTRILHLALLRRAATDLAALPRPTALVRGHARLVEGALAWVAGDARAAATALAAAARLGQEQTAPWILYGVARVRAHMLRERGDEAGARAEGRTAVALALAHGSAPRARWVREELGLDPEPAAAGRSVAARLEPLLAAAGAPRDEEPLAALASRLLGEMAALFAAATATLLFAPSPAVPPVLVARAAGAERTPGPLELARLRAALAGVDGVEPAVTASGRSLLVRLGHSRGPSGALALERLAGALPFGDDDLVLAKVAAASVASALELGALRAERSRLEATLRRANRAEVVGTLAAGLAHDFNGLLAAMGLVVSGARERAGGDAALGAHLETLAEALSRAAGLTGQLVGLARPGPARAEPVEIHAVLARLAPWLRGALGPGVEVVFEPGARADRTVVDPRALEQALVNLLVNAGEAMPAGGRIAVTTRDVVLGAGEAARLGVEAGDYVEVAIVDAGRGMSPEMLARAGEPFVTRKSGVAGAGLGLASVRAIVAAAHGALALESAPGVGTTARLYLRSAAPARPRRDGPPLAAAAAPGAPTAAAPPSRDTILVVDDDELVRRSIAKILERNGYRVLAATNPSEALRVARDERDRIGLVILDFLMPGTTGPELGRRLDALAIPAKVLFVSGFSANSPPVEDAKIAADMLLQKPFSQRALLERVRELLQRDAN